MNTNRLERISDIYRGICHLAIGSFVLVLADWAKNAEGYRLGQASRRMGYGELRDNLDIYGQGVGGMINILNEEGHKK